MLVLCVVLFGMVGVTAALFYKEALEHNTTKEELTRKHAALQIALNDRDREHAANNAQARQITALQAHVAEAKQKIKEGKTRVRKKTRP